jgi:predicted adenine nucleotide alpha hydrolase (AANH) superfamily ATPase
MKVLLHTCCGPCAIYPLSRLQEAGHNITAYFFNPNIHPFKEFQRRLNTLKDFTEKKRISTILHESYGLKDFLRKIVFHEDERCSLCYAMRLTETATAAKNGGFEAFTSTLLYSKYQNHDQIRLFCEKLAKESDLTFIYEDYRKGWQIGIDKSKKFDMYRQPYCGCVYSEQERYDKSLTTNK